LGIDEEYAREIGVEADNLLNEIRNKEHNRMQANQQIVKLKGQINEVYERSRQLIDELNSKIGLSRKEEKGASKINPLFNTHEDFLAYLD
jgi:predicted  nucleic acid-binding Zn-ribbon protein